MVGLATYKKDAFYYVTGLFIGMFIFGEAESSVHSFFVGGFMGKRMTLPEYLDLSTGVVAFGVVLIALAGFWGSEKLEKRFGGKGG